MRRIIPLSAIFLALLVVGCATRQPLPTVKSVDLKRYSGKWYEVARYPNWFQRNCASAATATYTPLPDGKIQVVNTCLDAKGKPMGVKGTATVVPNSGNAKLKVKFFGPFAGDYWIIGLDEKDYSWALVGHPSRRYLWILSREPKMDAKLYERILALADERGYDVSRIQKTSH
jgi:apolipoprotein D and lipocalin family protein